MHRHCTGLLDDVEIACLAVPTPRRLALVLGGGELLSSGANFLHLCVVRSTTAQEVAENCFGRY